MSVSDNMIEAKAPPPLPPRPWTVARTAGTAAMALWLVVGVGIILFLVAEWDPEKIERYAPRYFSGLGVTITLVAISVFLGAILSVPVTMGRMSSRRWFSVPAYGYVYFFRGTPLIAQLFLIYYGLGEFRPQLEAIGLWGFFRDPWNCAILAFTLNTAAYQAEILRGALQSVPRGQFEGARALGLGRLQTYRKIIIPQAMIVALRPYGNEIILMIKGSAIVAIITVFDLFGETRRAYSRTFDFQTYIWAAIFYLIIVEALRNLWNWFERRLTRHLKR
ncbi:ABC transporter permease [Hoeflea prorocentri]|uniref:ABC transporter permease n=1 Tax=Hoeflea prorocentri TaxID=1922333 RepID=A0A9X3UGK4_9HYPH|nr:ABC transporter permease [Hoeflea prorocentri]MCY6380276.1 ABC transporter permease [Hoeflea prorocentri]MDA5398076.1 ABC transporter permease [Hoeflea prorocentri]